MGAYQSTNADYNNAVQSFIESEQSQMHNLYKNLTGGGKWLTAEQLQAHCSRYLASDISKSLHLYMKKHESEELQKNVSASFEGFVVAMAHALKGNLDEKLQLLSFLAGDPSMQGTQLSQIIHVIEQFWSAYHKILTVTPTYLTWKLSASEPRGGIQPIARSLVHDLISDGKSLQCEMPLPAGSTVYDGSKLYAWLQNNALLLRMIDVVFHACFPIGFALDSENFAQPPFPICTHVDWKKSSTVLDAASIAFINFHLPHELRQEWRFLFDSNTHGESFSTMCRKITNQGPSLMVFKDTKGHVFGGFASQSWAYSSKFEGSPSCFLFRLRPELEVYPATGYNNHFMYFNHGQETLPNGLGFGGQLGYFGLFLDEEFNHGHSKAEPRCTTYSSPQLSAASQFQLASLEVWGLGPVAKPTDEEEEEAKARGSILDKDPEAKAMLSLIDKGPHSEGLRDRDPMADTPEEHQLPSGLG